MGPQGQIPGQQQFNQPEGQHFLPQSSTMSVPQMTSAQTVMAPWMAQMAGPSMQSTMPGGHPVMPGPHPSMAMPGQSHHSMSSMPAQQPTIGPQALTSMSSGQGPSQSMPGTSCHPMQTMPGPGMMGPPNETAMGMVNPSALASWGMVNPDGQPVKTPINYSKCVLYPPNPNAPPPTTRERPPGIEMSSEVPNPNSNTVLYRITEPWLGSKEMALLSVWLC